MILPLLLAIQGPLPITLEQLEVPVMGGMREVILGMVERRLDTIGLFIDNYNKMYDETGKIPINFVNPRIGSIVSSVAPAIYGSTPCLVIDADSTRTQTVRSGYEYFDLRMKLKRQWWVTAEGKILSEAFRFEAGGNVWTMEAKYDADTFTIKLNSPDRGPRTLGPVTPGMGMEELTTTAFKPMVKLPNEVVLKDKTFYLLDPFTGGPVKYQAHVKGKFSGTYTDDRVYGVEVDIAGGPEKALVSISDRGLLIKAVLEKYKYLSLEQRPGQ